MGLQLYYFKGQRLALQTFTIGFSGTHSSTQAELDSPFVGVSTLLTSRPLLYHHFCLRIPDSLALTLSDLPDLSPHGPSL